MVKHSDGIIESYPGEIQIAHDWGSKVSTKIRASRVTNIEFLMKKHSFITVHLLPEFGIVC